MKIFGEPGWEATRSKLDDNLLVMDAVHMLDPKHLNRDLAKKALPYLMFLKRKRSGKIKARGCANGRGQRAQKKKQDLQLYQYMH